MKNYLLSLFLLIIFVNIVFSQQIPEGNLWVHTSGTPGELGYFETNTGTYQFTHTIELGDIILYDSLLLAGKDDLYIFSASSGEKLDSLMGVDIHQMDMWGDRLVVTSSAPPYFRVYSLASMSQLFSLDTTKMASPGFDLLVLNDLAFISLDTFVQVIDLVVEDTLLQIQTEHPFFFAGMNMFLVPYGEFVFVDVEYVTGAIRSSMMRIDLSDFSCQTLYHLEGAGNLVPPLPVGDTLFIMNYPSYYDIANDSVYSLPWSGEMKAALDFDATRKSIFVYDYLQHSITVEQLSTGDSLMGYQLNTFLGKALFYSTATTTSIEELEPEIVVDIFPIPTSTEVSIRINSSVGINPSFQIYTISGERIENLRFNKSGEGSFDVDVSHLLPGIYIIGIQSGINISIERIAIVR
ncbi:MAG: T9SS type A sorting domain-containing protein [Bacteroidales bacterium]|nr:T9SS type A sorting domain-containing protein [Bacteroidales bacterium]MCF8455978.1 T9SS type A sorting domain-containing protein [Bacteroidales bacterium]